MSSAGRQDLWMDPKCWKSSARSWGDFSGGLNPLLQLDRGCHCVGHRARAPGSSSLANKQPRSPGCRLRAFPRALRADSSQVVQPLGPVVKATGTPTSPTRGCRQSAGSPAGVFPQLSLAAWGREGISITARRPQAPRASGSLLLPLSLGTQHSQHGIAPALSLKATLGALTSKTSHSRKSTWLVPGSPATQQREPKPRRGRSGGAGRGPAAGAWRLAGARRWGGSSVVPAPTCAPQPVSRASCRRLPGAAALSLSRLYERRPRAAPPSPARPLTLSPRAPRDAQIAHSPGMLSWGILL